MNSLVSGEGSIFILQTSAVFIGEGWGWIFQNYFFKPNALLTSSEKVLLGGQYGSTGALLRLDCL